MGISGLWSVSVEEQFYLLSPFAVQFLSRYRLIALAIVLIFLSNTARFFLLQGKILTPDALWYCTLTRLDPIATGVLASLLLRRRVPMIGPLVRGGVFVTGAICLYTAANWFHGVDKNFSVIDGMVAYPLATVGALAIFLSFLGAPINWEPLIYLGQISYGLYVFHLFALDITKLGLLQTIGRCPFWLRGIVGLPITVGLAAASYAWLEKPFLQLKRRYALETLVPSLRATGARVPILVNPASTAVGDRP
jgi:peptidoglycan/LPS O-acetylase OafA/YrhL